MKRMFVAIPCLMALTACNSVTGPLAKMTIPEGQTRRIGFFTDLNADCTSRGPITVRIIEQPAHGRLRIEEAADYPSYGKENQRYECNTRKVQGTRVMYTPSAGFEGTDRVVGEVLYPSGLARTSGVEITIK